MKKGRQDRIAETLTYSSDSWGIGFPEGYFSAETFHNAYPSAGMPMGRAFVKWLKDLKEK